VRGVNVQFAFVNLEPVQKSENQCDMRKFNMCKTVLNMVGQS